MRIIPIHADLGAPASSGPAPLSPASRQVATGNIRAIDAALPLRDRLDRPLTDLRLSVTDRCNFRCVYCMPRNAFGPGHRFLSHQALLSFEEIARVAGIAVRLGVSTLRLTGGEPLLRKNLDRLVALLRPLAPPQGQPLDIAMTTNGSLLGRHAAALKAAGLDRVTISLDALDDTVLQRMSDATTSVREVLASIEQARAVGLGRVKINMVVRRGWNDNQILPMARHFAQEGLELRFIEYMDVGATNGWSPGDVVTAQEILRRLSSRFTLEPVLRDPGDTALRFRDMRTGTVFGVVASITKPFCGDCSRLRLGSDGRLHTCLFSAHALDLRTPLRSGWDDQALERMMREAWQGREDRYSERRALHAGDQAAPHHSVSRAEMSYLGG